jgi:hypothetical protein
MIDVLRAVIKDPKLAQWLTGYPIAHGGREPMLVLTYDRAGLLYGTSWRIDPDAWRMS